MKTKTQNSESDQLNYEDLYSTIEEILIDTSLKPQNKLLQLYFVLSEIINFELRHEPTLFADTYSKIHFILQKNNFPDYLREQVSEFRRLIRSVRRDWYEPKDQELAAVVRILSEIITRLTSFSVPKKIRIFYEKFPPLSRSRKVYYERERVNFVRSIIVTIEIEDHELNQKIGSASIYEENITQRKKHIITMDTVECGQIRLVVWGSWAEQSERFEPGMLLNVFLAETLDKSASLFTTTADSLLVIEPDYLFNVTEVAECFMSDGVNPNIALLRKIIPSEPSKAMILGSIVNEILDELCHGSYLDIRTIVVRTISKKPFAFLAIVEDQNCDEVVNNLIQEAQIHAENIQKTIEKFQSTEFVTEPSFLSPEYGLQGRLDVMISNGNRKDVIELKSSKAPENKGLWRNHLAQVACYHLLLDSAFDHRVGTTNILYSKVSNGSLRHAPIDALMKRIVIQVRNEIVLTERKFSHRKLAQLNYLHPDHFGKIPPFLKHSLEKFAIIFASLDAVEKNYFRYFISFVSREDYYLRCGLSTVEKLPSVNNSMRGIGFSTLWTTSLSEKENLYAVLAYLIPDEIPEADSAHSYIRLRRTTKTLSVAPFRAGDIIILYNHNENGTNNPLLGRVLKGSIKKITTDEVLLSIRALPHEVREGIVKAQFPYWALENDYNDSSAKAMISSLFEFISSDKHFRNLILGRYKPAYGNFSVPKYDDLTDEQNSYLEKILLSKNYFLLQGPPGTGKTSKMLRSIIQTLYTHSDENVLVLAYTNRAVDEICFAIQRISPAINFLRLGTRDVTVHSEFVAQEVFSGKTPSEIQLLVQGKRVIVATVASILSHREIFSLKKFGTIIIDEASQIVEPMLVGILSKSSRFVLIGDQMQLPPVVVQPENGVAIHDEELKKLGLYDVRTSLFERLWNVCTKNQWLDSIGTLSKQGRMHVDIQDYISEIFYLNKITPLNLWQLEKSSEPFIISPATSRGLFIRENRVTFFPALAEGRGKIHSAQATLASILAQEVYLMIGAENFSEESLGIIAPFRAQVAEITSLLPEHIREKVTVDTVERFQGSERDVIIISTTISTAHQLSSLQSLSIDKQVDRKLNVAVSRAKKRLIVLGVESVLQQAVFYRELLERAATYKE